MFAVGAAAAVPAASSGLGEERPLNLPAGPHSLRDACTVLTDTANQPVPLEDLDYGPGRHQSASWDKSSAEVVYERGIWALWLGTQGDWNNVGTKQDWELTQYTLATKGVEITQSVEGGWEWTSPPRKTFFNDVNGLLDDLGSAYFLMYNGNWGWLAVPTGKKPSPNLESRLRPWNSVANRTRGWGSNTNQECGFGSILK